MSALTDAKAALAELKKTTRGYQDAKKQNPKMFSSTHQGRCEAALHAVIAALSPSPTSKCQLPEKFTPTHETSGLDGYPAVDVFARGSTVMLSPATGEIRRLSGHPVTPKATPGGPYGLSVYLKRPDGGEYFLTHFGTLQVRTGDHVKKGDPLGTVADYSRATGGVTPSHIHEGFHP